MIYAFREALRLIAEETLPASWARHRAPAEFFWKGLEDMGLECLVPYENRCVCFVYQWFPLPVCFVFCVEVAFG